MYPRFIKGNVKCDGRVPHPAYMAPVSSYPLLIHVRSDPFLVPWISTSQCDLLWDTFLCMGSQGGALAVQLLRVAKMLQQLRVRVAM